MLKISKILNRPVCFVLGIVLTLVTMPVFSFVRRFLTGFEILSVSSFPRTHIAILYSRGGPGEQTFFLEVDGTRVYVSGDAAPGNLHEKLIWDEIGKIVTLELEGQKIFIYDAESKSEIKE